MPAIIRPYRPADRSQIRQIFKDTAFHGKSYSGFFDDGEWLADFMSAYYTDFEPESTFVSEENGTVTGYLNGALDTKRFRSAWKRDVLPLVARGFFSRGVAGSPRAWRFFWRGFLSSLKGEEKISTGLFEEYPAHFHINLRESSRGHGAGHQLAAAFFKRARENNVHGVHIRTAHEGGRHPFFESLGFKIVASNPLSLWKYVDPTPYHLITYGIKI